MVIMLGNGLGKVEANIGKGCFSKNNYFIHSWEKLERKITYRNLFDYVTVQFLPQER